MNSITSLALILVACMILLSLLKNEAGRKGTQRGDGYFVKFNWHRIPVYADFKWKEEDIQSYIVFKLRELQERNPAAFEFEAGMEGIKLSIYAAKKAKALGMGNGFTDIKIYLSRARMLLIELKTKRGVLTDSQKERHPKLAKLGFKVHVVKAKTPADGWGQVASILDDYGI